MVIERESSAPMPWVCLPGQKLPPAPPLWATIEGGALVTHRPCPCAKCHEDMSSPEMVSAGWSLVVDAEGRSR